MTDDCKGPEFCEHYAERCSQIYRPEFCPYIRSKLDHIPSQTPEPRKEWGLTEAELLEAHRRD